MNFKQTYFLLVFLLSVSVFSQNKIKGSIVDENSKPIIHASIYVDGSTIQTKTNEKGEFELNLPNGQYNLIAKADLFENFILGIKTNQNQRS